MRDDEFEDGNKATLHTRFVVARGFATGRLSGWTAEAKAAEHLGISPKTLKRDIARARLQQTFDDWRPKRRGPQPGKRHVRPDVLCEVEQFVRAAQDQKLNVRKMSRDLELLLGSRFSAKDVPSQSTIERIIHDVLDQDPAHFAFRQHGRKGRHNHSLQIGSLETERAGQIVCLDHTPLDARAWLFDTSSWVVIRPVLTAALDVHTGCCLAAFILPHAPNRVTVSLAMALMASPKTSLLRAYGIPGQWEACALPEVLYVDGAAELTADSVARGCQINGIELRVGWPGRPERRAKMERFWRTLNSEIHSWPGTTLSNPQDLAAHGGPRPVAWDFGYTQRMLLTVVSTYNNETYGGPKIPPIMQWREWARTPHMRRTIPQDPVRTFRDFLPFEPKRTVNFEGIKLEGCEYRSGALAALRYQGVHEVAVVFDPRDMSRIWAYYDRTYIEVERAYPRYAPEELFALKHWQKQRRQEAAEKRDDALLQKLAAIRTGRSSFSFLDSAGEPVDAQPPSDGRRPSIPQVLKPLDLSAFPPRPSATPDQVQPGPPDPGPAPPAEADPSEGGEGLGKLPPNFDIPEFKSWLR